MDTAALLSALVLGIVEGLTEFLPISSTGHLILAGELLGFNDDRGKLFEIVIQSGAILAVCWEYRRRIITTLGGWRSVPAAQQLIRNLALAFLPAAFFGLLLGSAIKRHLFAPVPVALAFIVGGFIILWAEKRAHTVRITEIDSLRGHDALKIGMVQCLALIPGVSRSGATIIGGLFLGLSRQTATEFSFFLAIPTLFAATAYQLYRERALLHGGDWDIWLTGFVAAFVSAFFCVRWLLRFISRHDFTPFAWYRIAFGLIILLTSHTGWVDWTLH